MFRLPICPHCHTVYRYRDVWQEASKQRGLRKKDKGKNACYHCGQNFCVSDRAGIVVMLLIWAACSITTNLILLSRMTELNIFLMMLATLLYAVLFAILYPFFVKFKKIKEKHSNKMKEKR